MQTKRSRKQTKRKIIKRRKSRQTKRRSPRRQKGGAINVYGQKVEPVITGIMKWDD